MTLASIKKHLRPYSIAANRTTTISHAFASAIAPTSPYDEAELRKAMAHLGQGDGANLRCVYCGKSAETWDHLNHLVRNAALFGFGHQLGNLVPACGDCNSRSKGRADWREFVESLPMPARARREMTRRPATYQRRFAKPIDLDEWRATCPEEWAEFERLREQILKITRRADAVAARIRAAFPRRS